MGGSIILHAPAISQALEHMPLIPAERPANGGLLRMSHQFQAPIYGILGAK